MVDGKTKMHTPFLRDFLQCSWDMRFMFLRNLAGQSWRHPGRPRCCSGPGTQVSRRAHEDRGKMPRLFDDGRGDWGIGGFTGAAGHWHGGLRPISQPEKPALRASGRLR